MAFFELNPTLRGYGYKDIHVINGKVMGFLIVMYRIHLDAFWMQFMMNIEFWFQSLSNL